MARLKKRKDGRYQKKVTLPDGTSKLVYGTNESELTKKADQLKKSHETGVDFTDQTTVAQWSLEWLKIYKSAMRYKTKEAYLNTLNAHILPQIGSLRLQAVKAIHIQGIMNAVANKSESLQSKVRNTMRQLFRDGRINHLVVFDPTEGIKITANTKADKIKFLSKEQQDSLMISVTEPRARCFCALCLYAGLRREEALGLQWGDINFDKGTLTISRALSFTKNQPDPNMSLKTKAANRTIPLLGRLRNVLEQTPRTGIYVITPISGRMMSLTAFRRMWYYASSQVSFSVYPHMLRHTYATLLHSAEVDLKTAQYLLGHSDIKMTANIYTHIEKGQTMKAAQKIEDFLSSSQEGSQGAEKA